MSCRQVVGLKKTRSRSQDDHLEYRIYQQDSVIILVSMLTTVIVDEMTKENERSRIRSRCQIGRGIPYSFIPLTSQRQSQSPRQRQRQSSRTADKKRQMYRPSSPSPPSSIPRKCQRRRRREILERRTSISILQFVYFITLLLQCHSLSERGTSRGHSSLLPREDQGLSYSGTHSHVYYNYSLYTAVNLRAGYRNQDDDKEKQKDTLDGKASITERDNSTDATGDPVGEMSVKPNDTNCTDTLADEKGGAEAKSDPFWPGLFALNNDVKSDAAQDADDFSVINQSNDTQTVSATSTHGRGGALVKTAKPPSPRPFLHWLNPPDPDTQQVADREVHGTNKDTTDQTPYIDRPVESRDTHQREDGKTDTLRHPGHKSDDAARKKHKKHHAKAKQKHEKLKDTEREYPTDHESRGDGETEGSTLAASRHETPINDGDVDSSGTFDLDSSSSSTVDLIGRQGNILFNDSTISDVVDETAESLYVSSGYWTMIDKVTTLGYAETHPEWRISKRLRPLRKATARATGLHGVLSGKHTAHSDEATLPVEISSIYNLTEDKVIVEQEQDQGRGSDEASAPSLDDDVSSTNLNESLSIYSEGNLDQTPMSNIPMEQTRDDIRVVLEPGYSISSAMLNESAADEVTGELESPYVSSGYWSSIDKALTFGYAISHPEWRVSRRLRLVRKAAARMTGLHGFLSGKNVTVSNVTKDMEDQRLGAVRRRLAVIARARENAALVEGSKNAKQRGARRLWGRKKDIDGDGFAFVMKKDQLEMEEERKRKERVKEIDRLIGESQKRLQQLACEKDVLQRRPSPLWNYTVNEKPERGTVDPTAGLVSAARRFNFPPRDLVDEYLVLLFSSGRLLKLNHTDLWKNAGEDEDDDDDDELVSAAELQNRRRKNSNGSSGNWLLRYGLGEKIGEAAETAAYKAVCEAVMSVLARSLSSLHGVNVMTHSDIRLFMEQVPDLPPSAGMIPGSVRNGNYAQGAIENAMRRGAKKRRKRRFSDDTFIQRDAVVETLLSHCQISAPLLQLFPLAWQRAMLGNIITLVTAVVADFCEGLEFHILGHRLSFAFTPISEADMLRQLGSFADGFNRHKASQAQFEEAVKATADDLEGELNFLDKWHERALGSGMLRTQIANLIARLVLTLVDDVLGGARMDLWTAQAGGPRLVAGLEYRTTPNYMDGRPTESD